MIISLNENIIQANLDDEYVLFDPENSNYINLNSSASLISNFLKVPVSEEDLLKKLSESIDENIETLKSDLKFFIDQAKKKNLIKINV